MNMAQYGRIEIHLADLLEIYIILKKIEKC